MTSEERTRLSYYQELAPLNAAHGVMLVRHAESGLLFVKKTLTNYQLSIYERLKARPFEGMPQVIEAVEDDGCLIVIETYLSGRNLQEILDEQGVFPPERVRNIALALCRILVPLHGAGIVHRDIKPSNVILTAGDSVRLLDLDAARIYKPGETRDTRLIGTKGYAAPEQYGFGASTPATDIYALGILMNVLLTGQFPREQLTADPAMRVIIERCTRLEPSERFASAGELAGSLLGMDGDPAGRGVPDRRMPERVRTYTGSVQENGSRRFLPPGFRSGNLRNMLFAALWYLLMIGVMIREVRDPMVPADKAAVLVFTAAAFLGAPAVFCNYLNLQDRLGSSRMEPKSRRFWACSGVYVLFLVLVTALGKVLQMLFGGSV